MFFIMMPLETWITLFVWGCMIVVVLGIIVFLLKCFAYTSMGVLTCFYFLTNLTFKYVINPIFRFFGKIGSIIVVGSFSLSGFMICYQSYGMFVSSIFLIMWLLIIIPLCVAFGDTR